MSDTKKTDLYTFTHKGKSYTFERPLADARTPKWLRENRRRSELDQTFTLIEDFGGDEVVEAIDDMTEDEFSAFGKKLMKELSATFR